MTTWAHIVDGVVVNISVWDGVTPWSTKDTVVQIPDGAGVVIGWSYVDEQFIDPNPVVLPEVDAPAEVV